MNNIAKNNVYVQCPAISYSGRHSTIHTRTHELAYNHMMGENIKNSNEYRLFLQNNAEQLINADRQYINNSFVCERQKGCSAGYQSIN